MDPVYHDFMSARRLDAGCRDLPTARLRLPTARFGLHAARWDLLAYRLHDANSPIRAVYQGSPRLRSRLPQGPRGGSSILKILGKKNRHLGEKIIFFDFKIGIEKRFWLENNVAWKKMFEEKRKKQCKVNLKK